MVKKDRHCPWYILELRLLKSACRKLERKWRSSGLTVHREIWTDHLGSYRRVLTTARVKYSEIIGHDLLAVPKHPYAAMENWGLSVFVEQKILLDPGVSSISYLMDVTMVIVHEICHQWFGDLVTPVWWEDVWLKEGFAHFFEFLGADFLFPDWHMGAALIRMLANVMGQPVFQMGLNDYLITHMYGNAGRDDLWNKFSEAMQKEGRDINIKEVMDLWTLQMGYPVVTITKKDSVDNRLTISQEHFIFDIKDSVPSNSRDYRFERSRVMNALAHNPCCKEAVLQYRWMSDISDDNLHEKEEEKIDFAGKLSCGGSKSAGNHGDVNSYRTTGSAEASGGRYGTSVMELDFWTKK
ncbi:UNVERIFIED_CONTAM: hypothetical protein FKN15_033779 [Acipenser sinensis]